MTAISGEFSKGFSGVFKREWSDAMTQDFLSYSGVEVQEMDTEGCHITIKGFVKNKALDCPICGTGMKRSGKRTVMYHDLPIGLKHITLTIVHPKYTCQNCGHVTVLSSPDFDDKRKCTLRLIETIKRKSLSIAFCDLCEYTGVEMSLIKSIALENAKELEGTVKFVTPTVMAINKVAIADETRYVITNVEKKSLFAILDAKLDSNLKKYLSSLPDRKEVTWVFEDLKMPLREVLYSAFPNCRAIVHKKNTIELLNDCLEKECYLRQILLDSKQKGLTNKIIKILTKKNKGTLTASDRKDLAEVKKICPELANSFNLKEDFLACYEIEDVPSAKFEMSMWCDSLPHNLALLTHFSEIIKNSLIEIMAYWSAPSEIIDAYLDCYDELRAISNYVGNTNNYRVVRARLLYDEDARNLNRVDRVVGGVVEYGSSLERLRERIN